MKKRSNRIQDASRLIKKVKKASGSVNENTDGIFSKATRKSIKYTVKAMEKDLENYKTESSEETMTELNRINQRFPISYIQQLAPNLAYGGEVCQLLNIYWKLVYTYQKLVYIPPGRARKFCAQSTLIF